MGRVAQVRGDQRLVGVAGELGKSLGVGADLGEQAAFPRSAADRVEQREVA